MAKLLQEAIKKTMSELTSCVSEVPMEFVCKNDVPLNDFVFTAEIIMG